MLVFFLACATAYAFFQVPYVAMPAEMTDVLRRAHPADDLAGGDPGVHDHARRRDRAADPRRRRRPRRLPGDGRRDGGASSSSASWAPTSAPGTPRSARSSRAPGPCATSCGSSPAPATSGCCWPPSCIQALATGCMLAGVDYLASDVLGGRAPATVLFVCFVGPALLLTPAWAALGARIGKKQGYLLSSRRPRRRRRCWPCSRASAPPAWSSRRRPWSASGTPAARSSRSRCCPTRRPSTPGGPGATGPASTPASGPPARRSGLALGPGLFALVLALGGYRSSTDGESAQPDSALTAITLGFSLLPALAGRAQPACGCARYTLDSDQVDEDVDRSHDMTDALARLQRAPGRRPAGARRPDPGLRLRLRAPRRGPDRPRGGRGVRRLQRARPDRVPEPAADGERPGRLRPAACSTRPTPRSAP